MSRFGVNEKDADSRTVRSKRKRDGTMRAIGPKKDGETQKKPRAPYRRPAIVREGVITTRAGSPVSAPASSDSDGVDPADLFGSG